MSRIRCPVLAAKVVAAEEAVAHIHDGDNVGFSGFTGAGYPKAVPTALAAAMIGAHDEGRQQPAATLGQAHARPQQQTPYGVGHLPGTRPLLNPQRPAQRARFEGLSEELRAA